MYIRAEHSERPPHHLSVSPVDLTATIKRSLAATRLVGPLIQDIGPIDTVSAAQTAAPRPAVRRHAPKHTSRQNTILRVSGGHHHVPMDETTNTAGSPTGGACINLTLMIIEVIINVRRRTITNSGTLAILSIEIIGTRSTTKIAMIVFAKIMAVLTAINPESHHLTMRTTIATMLIDRSLVAIKSESLSIMTIIDLNLMARIPEDVNMLERKSITRRFKTEDTPRIRLDPGLASTKGATRMSVTTSILTVTLLDRSPIFLRPYLSPRIRLLVTSIITITTTTSTCKRYAPR